MHKHDCDNCPDKDECPAEAKAGWGLLNQAMDWFDKKADDEVLKKQVEAVRPAMMVLHSQAIGLDPMLQMADPRAVQKLINMAFCFGLWFNAEGMTRALPPITPVPKVYLDAFGMDNGGGNILSLGD